MKRIVVLLFLTMSLTGFAQESIPMWVIASAGGNSVSSDFSVSWTLGETAYTTLESDEGYLLTQGFQQGNIFITAIEDNYVNLSLDLRIYPNPVNNFFNILLTSDVSSRTLIEIFDITGRLVAKSEANIIPNEPYTVDARNLNVGIYLVRITNKNRTSVVKLTRE